MKLYRYVLVRFKGTSKKCYYYRTNNKKLKIRDIVIVPVGKDDHLDVAEIVAVKDFAKNEIPYPLEKTKQVVGKATKFRCILAALGDAIDKAIMEREKQEELQEELQEDEDDLAWIDEIEMWSAFFED